MAFPAIAAALGRGAAAGGAAGGAAEASAATSGVTKALGGLKSGAGGASNAVNRLNAGVGKMGAVMGSVVNVLATGSNAIKALAAPLAQFVGLRSPAALKQFELALNDMNAVIGDMLLPVFTALIRAARSMGDTYATLESRLQPIFTSMADSIGVVFKAIGSVARDNAGALQIMAEVMGGLIKVSAQAAAGALKLLNVLGGFGILKTIAAAIGIGPPKEESGRGRAIRNISIGGSGEDVARKAQEAAFAAALGVKPKEEPVVSALDKILEFLDKNLSHDKLLELVAAIIGGLAEKIAGKTGANAAAGVAGTLIPGTGARFLASLMTR
jgi:hypothetical protein